MATVRKRSWRAASGEEKTAWVADYFDGAGKRHIKTFKTRKAADEWLVNARGEVQRGTHTPENASVTVREAAGLWLSRCELEGLERSTLRFYRILFALDAREDRILQLILDGIVKTEDAAFCFREIQVVGILFLPGF